VLGQYVGVQVGSSGFPVGYPQFVIYNCIKAGIAGGSQVGWSTTPGDIIIDGTSSLQCIGSVVYILSASQAPVGATTYNITANQEIIDPSNYLQANTNTTVETYTWPDSSLTMTMPGGFSQTAPPTWNDTTGGITTETQTLTTPVPAATWVCLSLKPSPPSTLVGANIAQIVPLFVTINNGTQSGTSNVSTFNATELIAPTDTTVGTFTFRKEQLKFGFIPTISKVACVAAPIDNTQPSSIAISIDGGATFGTTTDTNGVTRGFPNITQFPGTQNPQSSTDSFSDVFSSGVSSLERPQLVLQLMNVQVVEAWYQGTLADFSII
jgi:hypothetical protein